jgi:hypothetical protein
MFREMQAMIKDIYLFTEYMEYSIFSTWPNRQGKVSPMSRGPARAAAPMLNENTITTETQGAEAEKREGNKISFMAPCSPCLRAYRKGSFFIYYTFSETCFSPCLVPRGAGRGGLSASAGRGFNHFIFCITTKTGFPKYVYLNRPELLIAGGRGRNDFPAHTCSRGRARRAGA